MLTAEAGTVGWRWGAVGGSGVRVRCCHGGGRGGEREGGREEGRGRGCVRLCGNGAHPWEVPEGPVRELCLAASSRGLAGSSCCPSFSVCGVPAFLWSIALSPASSSEPPLSPRFPRCSPSVPSHSMPFLAPAAPDLLCLLSSQFLPLCLLPSSFHPPSPSCASFCLSRASPFRLCLLLLLLRGGCVHRNISGGEGGGRPGERLMEEQC